MVKLLATLGCVWISCQASTALALDGFPPPIPAIPGPPLLGDPTPETTSPDVPYMTPSQKHVAEQLTSIWENDTPVLQYDYAEDIKDGRGYTAGRAGFCSGTGDMILVVQCFDEATANDNPLHKYMPELKRINDLFESTGDNQSDTKGLKKIGNFVKDWASSANAQAYAAAFDHCQDEVNDELYYRPAMKMAAAYGISHALSRAVFYDTAINHGEDGAEEIANYTNARFTMPKAPTLADEEKWLSIFLARRYEILSDVAVWDESTGRVVNYQALVKSANWDLDKEFDTLKTESQYTVYHIVPDPAIL